MRCAHCWRPEQTKSATGNRNIIILNWLRVLNCGEGKWKGGWQIIHIIWRSTSRQRMSSLVTIRHHRRRLNVQWMSNVRRALYPFAYWFNRARFIICRNFNSIHWPCSFFSSSFIPRNCRSNSVNQHFICVNEAEINRKDSALQNLISICHTQLVSCRINVTCQYWIPWLTRKFP